MNLFSTKTRRARKVYEKQLKAMNLARLLSEAEAQIATGETRPARTFLNEFKKARKI